MNNPNAQKMAEDILKMLVGWEVVDKNDPDYQLFTQDIVSYLSKAASLSEAMIDQQARALAALREAVKPVIDQADLDAATRSPYGLGAQFNFYEVTLTGPQVDALRAALEAKR